MENKNEKFEGAVRKFQKVCDIIKSYNNDKNKLIPILQQVQHEYRYLPEEILAFIATSLEIPTAKVYGVATFYAHFALKPKGKYIIKVCDGTACHVKNSIPIVNAIQKKLKIDESKNTTEDMMFTLETVSCLGACGLAPVVVVNEDVYSCMNPQKIDTLIEEIMNKEVEYADA